MPMGLRPPSSDPFAVMQLASCSPATFQGPRQLQRPAPASCCLRLFMLFKLPSKIRTIYGQLGLDEFMAAGNAHKRQLYSIFEAASEEAGDEDQLGDEYSFHTGKKRRLTIEQVKALENSFELENKLEPERKLHLARELGLQPRQVAVWFQNRRARWKTKQLEKDYDLLKADYDALKLDYEAIVQEKENLQTQLLRLNEKHNLSGHGENQLPKGSALSELRREITLEAAILHPPISKASDKATDQSTDLISSLEPLQLLRNNMGDDNGSSSSESDDSEVLDEESPLLMELPKQPLCPSDPSSLTISTAKEDDEKLAFSHRIPLQPVVKLEDEPYNNDEGGNLYLFNLEDHVTSFSWWDV